MENLELQDFQAWMGARATLEMLGGVFLDFQVLKEGLDLVECLV